MERGLIGQGGLIRGLLVGLLAGGHVLIEGVPGLGKTRAVNLLARICQLRFRRLQFTPDLLPADVVGTRIYNQHSATFETVRGPIFANVVLADEINRAPAKVQSALLETMQEKQVTIGQESLPVPTPFIVFATQNPIEQEGTYPLPEAQLDRFLLKLRVDYPAAADEWAIVRLVIDEEELPAVRELLARHQVEALQAAVRGVFIEERLIRYATELVHATRRPQEAGLELAPYVELGASPRASIALAQAARASALIDGRDAVEPDDVKAVAHPVLRHRILLTYYADAEGVASDAIVDQVLDAVEVP
ncbi:MAG: AAA family ATPase [Acidobacteria bacterium]|nr:MAG: AAA family ATPase [Acidobacteriota bacterium]